MPVKRTLDRAITVLAAVAAPVDALLIDVGVYSSQVGIDVGAIVAAAVAAYHGGAIVQRKGAGPRVSNPPN